MEATPRAFWGNVGKEPDVPGEEPDVLDVGNRNRKLSRWHKGEVLAMKKLGMPNMDVKI